MEKVNQAVKALTEAKAQQTQDLRINTKKWAEWLRIELCGDSQLERMVDRAATWATRIRANHAPQWLVLMGNSGVGKTHVATRLWKWIKTRPDFATAGAYIPQRIYWPQFVEDLRSGEAYGRFRDMMEWNYLFLDDVASERLSEFSTEKLHNLLGARVGKWTIITSNKGMGDIARLDPRIASRFLRDGSEIVDVRTTDYNLRQLQTA